MRAIEPQIKDYLIIYLLSHFLLLIIIIKKTDMLQCPSFSKINEKLYFFSSIAIKKIIEAKDDRIKQLQNQNKKLRKQIMILGRDVSQISLSELHKSRLKQQQIEKVLSQKLVKASKVSNWAELENSRFLNLGYSQLMKLPNKICTLQLLQQLYITNNKITSLPANIGNLINLTKIMAWENQLKELPESFSQLSQLRFMSMYSNQLVTLPQKMFRLNKLKQLQLWNNKLSAFPKNMQYLTELEQLNIKGNNFVSLPDFVSKLSNLQNLNIDLSCLITLKFDIQNLKCKSLVIWYKQMTVSVKEILVLQAKKKELKLVFLQLKQK